MTRYMVIESIRKGCLEAVYRRFHQPGRPIGPFHQAKTVFQLMRNETPEMYPVWTAHWDDLINFEIVAIGAAPGPE